MTRLPTISEVLKEHTNAVFTILSSNGKEVFSRPLTAKEICAGLDGYFRGCCVSDIEVENFLGVEFVTATLTWHF